MIKKKFFDNILKGLGSAYLELEKANDREEYKETLLYACFRDTSHDFIVEGSKGDYIYNLICLLDNKNIFKHEIIKYLQNNLPKRNIFAQLFDILECFAIDGDKEIKPFFKEYYQKFISKGKWTENKLLCYEYLCRKMTNVFGLRKVLKIIEDIERLRLNTEMLGWFIFQIHSRYKNNKIVQSFCKEEDVKLEKNEFEHTLEEFLELSKNDGVCYCFNSWANDLEYKKCLEYLHNTNDKTDVINILEDYQSYLSNTIGLRKIPEDLLIFLLNKFDKEVDCEIYRTLSYVKSKKIEKLAFNLLNDKDNLVNAIHMLMVNYKKQYKQTLVKAYKKVRFYFMSWNPLLSYTIDFMNSRKNNLPDEILFYAYKNSYDAFEREYIVDIMKKRNLLSYELLNELQYDSDYEIRIKAKKWLKK